jgi:TonB-linked SusC/RagA family outer membrane protein
MVKKWILKLIMLFAILAGTQSVFSQEKSVTGTITDEAGSAIPGANIVVQGTTVGTVTDLEGKYSITAPGADAVLVFSFVGYETQEITVGDQTTINVTLLPAAYAIDEVVAVGYGYMRRSDLTGSVASVRSEDLLKTTSINTAQALQGRAAGVSIEASDGDPGSPTRITIRGLGTVNNNEPLIVIDGIIGGSLDDLHPSDIASIEILKDASAAAIYGSNGANGVVLVTTKSGTPGATKINFDAYWGTSYITPIDMLNAEEFARMDNERQINQGALPRAAYLDPTAVGEGTDWQDVMFRLGFVQNYNLSVSGGSETSTFRLGLGYLSEDGSSIGAGSDKLTLNMGVDFTAGRLKIGGKIFGKHQYNDMNQWGNYGSKNAVYHAAMFNPWVDTDGMSLLSGNSVYGDENWNQELQFTPGVTPNYVAENFTRESWDDRVNANLYLDLDIVEGLKFRSQASGSFSMYKYIWFYPEFYLGPAAVTQNPDAKMIDDRHFGRFFNFENFLTYSKTLGGHSFQVMAGHTIRENHRTTISGNAANFPSNDIVSISAGSDNVSVGGGDLTSTLLSVFGRLNYNFKDRYLLQATMRRDGSSKFASENRWGTFPSASVGWRVDNEPFLEGITGIVSHLKIRGSWGVLGNSEIGDYRYQSFVWPTIHYVIGADQHKMIGASVKDFGTPDITWEESETINVGVDLGLMDNSLFLTAEYYKSTTTDMLVEMPIPGSSGGAIIDGRGFNYPVLNVGEILNSGFEFTSAFSKVSGAFSYSVNLNLAAPTNEVIELGYEDQIIWGGRASGNADSRFTTATKKGSEVAAFYLIETGGVFKNQGEIDNHTTSDGTVIQPDAEPGDMKYLDANDDGSIDDDDRVYMGSGLPKVHGGLTLNAAYRNFDLTLFFTGAYGHKLYNGSRNRIEPGLFNGGANVSRYYYENHWSESNPDGFLPRLVVQSANENSRMDCDRYLEDGSYTRLRTIQIGYSLPANMLSRLRLKKARVFINGQNLLLFTDYMGYDPELGGRNLLERGVDTGQSPVSRMVTGGIQIGF